jgi:hypothetical protein
MKTLIKFIEEARNPVQIDINKQGKVQDVTDLDKLVNAPSSENIPAKSKIKVPKSKKEIVKAISSFVASKLIPSTAGPKIDQPSPGEIPTVGTRLPKQVEPTTTQSKTQAQANQIPGKLQSAPKTGDGGISTSMGAPTKVRTQTKSKEEIKSPPKTQTQTKSKSKIPAPPKAPPPPPRSFSPRPRSRGFLPFFWLRMPKPPARIGPRYGSPENLLRQPRSGKKDVTDK